VASSSRPKLRCQAASAHSSVVAIAVSSPNWKQRLRPKRRWWRATSGALNAPPAT